MSFALSQSIILTPGGLDLNAPAIGWHNLVLFNGIVADSEDPNFPAALMANAATTYRWLSLITATQYVTISVAADEMVDYVGLARHNLGSGEIRITVQAFVSGVWTDVSDPMTPSTDAPLMLVFPEQLADSWRLKLEPLGGIEPTIAVVYLGRLLRLQRRIYVGHTPLPYGRQTEFTNSIMESGDFQGRIELKRRLTTSVNLQNLTPSWYRNYLDPFISLGRNTAFFWAWRPYTYPTEVGYGWLTNDPNPVNQRGNGMMQVNLGIGGLVL